MMGLRLNEGVSLDRIERLMPLDHAIDPAGLRRALASGWVRCTNGRLIATPAGRQLLDHVLRLLI